MRNIRENAAIGFVFDEHEKDYPALMLCTMQTKVTFVFSGISVS